MSELYRGVVKWFNDAKGFGFIEHQSGKDVFVHYSVIEQDGFKTLKDGEEVQYVLTEGDKGLHAAKVVRVNTENVQKESPSVDTNGVLNVGASEEPSATKPLVEMIEIENENAGMAEAMQLGIQEPAKEI